MIPTTEYTSTSKQRKNLAIWIEALRSGEYMQGQYALMTFDNAYCCLGVACEKLNLGVSLYLNKNLYSKMFADEFGLYGYSYTTNNDVDILSNLNDSGEYDEIGSLVPNSRYNFSQIADLLENYLDLLNVIAADEEGITDNGELN